MEFYKSNTQQEDNIIREYIFISHDMRHVSVSAINMDKIYKYSGHFPDCLRPLYDNPDALLSVVFTPFSFSALLLMSSVYNNISTSINPYSLSHAESEIIDMMFNLRYIYLFHKTDIDFESMFTKTPKHNEYMNMIDKFLSFRELDPSVIITKKQNVTNIL